MAQLRNFNVQYLPIFFRHSFILFFCKTYNTYCTVSLSLFAGLERILRRFSVFAEEPCKSTITTSKPCSPVFKEAQPRPSKPFIQFNLKFPYSLLVMSKYSIIVNYCNKTSSRIVFKQKGISVFFWIFLSHEVSRLSPYTHTKARKL